uniref:Uncharacterized protein n=1 Tax=Callorhinchus milii TaxID=7868 RepID=A0A4W3IV10_CALMI
MVSCLELNPGVLRGPGNGKGTQSLKIADRYGFEYISAGELLRRKMIQNTTSNRKWSLFAKIITNGELAPQVKVTTIKSNVILYKWWQIVLLST